MFGTFPSTALGTTIMYYVVGLVLQALSFGAYSVIIFQSSRMIIKRGLKAQANRNLFTITTGMYILTLGYFGFNCVNTAVRIGAFVNDPTNLTPTLPATKFFVLFNSVILINFLLSDGLLIWRARLICAPDHYRYMTLPLVFLVLGFLAVLLLISLRVASLFSITFNGNPAFVRIFDIVQVSTMNLSLISNVSTTGVVGVTAWQHRKSIRAGFKSKSSQGDRILRVFLESGVLYCLFGLFSVISSIVRLPYNTLGDIWIPTAANISGAYMPAILLLVNAENSLNQPTFLGSAHLPDAAADPVGLVAEHKPYPIAAPPRSDLVSSSSSEATLSPMETHSGPWYSSRPHLPV